MDNFLSDYVEYNSGDECPRNYHLCTGLTLIASAVARRVWIKRGYFTHFVAPYILLVGEQGDGKSSAKDRGKDLLFDALPDVPIAPSVTTREAICKYLGSTESIRTFKDPDDVLIEYHPYTLFINEFKNFISVNPSGMINFLTDVSDRKHFINETKGKGTDIIPNPFVVLLACETPEWIINYLRQDTITGGFMRRLIIDYEIDSTGIKPEPNPPANSAVLYAKLKSHLQKLPLQVGEFQWTPEARKFWFDWYVKNKTEAKDINDIAMRGYRKTKHELLVKVSACISLSEYTPKLVLEKHHLISGLALLDLLEINRPKLSIASGRNELAAPQQAILDLLERNDGMMPEREVLRNSGKDLKPSDQYSVLAFLRTTGQIYYCRLQNDSVGRMMILNEKTYAKKKVAGHIKDKQ